LHAINNQIVGASCQIDLTNIGSANATETRGNVQSPSSTRKMIFLGAVTRGQALHVKAKTGYKFVISTYKVVVDELSDVTTLSFLEQIEQNWVVEDTYTIPKGVVSVVVKAATTSGSGDVTSVLPSAMIEADLSSGGLIFKIADLENENKVVGQRLDIMDAIMEVPAKEVSLSNYIKGRTTYDNGNIVGSDKRSLFLLGKVFVGNVIHITAKSGYQFVVDLYTNVVKVKVILRQNTSKKNSYPNNLRG
jgi:hypothetical protein